MSTHPMPGILWVVRCIIGKEILSYAAKCGAGGGPLSPFGDFASCQPTHAFLSQVQRHVEVVRPVLAISITVEGDHTEWSRGLHSCQQHVARFLQKTSGVRRFTQLFEERGCHIK